MQVSAGVGTSQRSRLPHAPVTDYYELLDSKTPVASEDVLIQHLCTMRHEEDRVANHFSSSMFVFLDHCHPELLGNNSVTLHDEQE